MTENKAQGSKNPAAGGKRTASGSANTQRAYAADWKHFAAWCRRQATSPLSADPQLVAHYLEACASGAANPDKRPSPLSTIERRLSSLTWNFAERGQPLDRRDAHIARVIADIRKAAPSRPPNRKAAIHVEDVAAMVETLDRGTLRGLRDRAMLLIGFAGNLERSEITGLDLGPDQTSDGRGWLERHSGGLRLTLRSRTGLRTVDIRRAASETACPVAAVETWLRFARIDRGPLFRRVTGAGKAVGPERLHDQEITRLVKRAAVAAAIGGELGGEERRTRFSGRSLRGS